MAQEGCSEKEALRLAEERRNNDGFEHDLPPYSRSSPLVGQQPIAGFSHIPFAKYHIPDSRISPDQTTTTILSQALSSNPAALEALLNEQITLPPRPTVRITGLVQGPHLIFDLKLDLFRHVCPSEESNGSWAYTKVDGMDDSASPIRPDEKAQLMSGGPDVTGAGFWLRRFCADGAPVKKFIFKRAVINWDTEYLATEIRKLVLAAGFRGVTQVTFPVHRSVITIQSPHQVNGFVTSLRSAFVSPKKYEVLSVVWPYAKLPRNIDESFRGNRECMLQSEEAWLAEWSDCIKYAICSRRHGWVTTEDKVDVAMAGLSSSPS